MTYTCNFYFCYLTSHIIGQYASVLPSTRAGFLKKNSDGEGYYHEQARSSNIYKTIFEAIN